MNPGWWILASVVLAIVAAVVWAKIQNHPLAGWLRLALVAVVVVPLIWGAVSLAKITVRAEPGDSDPHPAASHELVVLGDSYTSGEGASSFYASTDDRVGERGNSCHQAPTAWAVKLADKHGLRLRFLACSGATTEDVTTRAQYPLDTDTTPTAQDVGYQPQLAGLVHELDDAAADGRTIDSVVLGIGGNDSGFSDVLTSCIAGSCVKKGTQRLEKLPEVRAALDATYAALVKAVHEHGGPHPPRVFVTNYPDPLGPTYCRPPHFDPDEYRLLSQQFIPAVDNAIAEAAQHNGIRLIDLRRGLFGARICDHPDPKRAIGINQLKAERTIGSQLTITSMLHNSFHPTAAGHGYLLPIVEHALGLTTAAGPVTSTTPRAVVCDHGPSAPLQNLTTTHGRTSLDRLVAGSSACVRVMGKPWQLRNVSATGELSLQPFVPKSDPTKTIAVEVRAQNGPGRWIDAIVTVQPSPPGPHLDLGKLLSGMLVAAIVLLVLTLLTSLVTPVVRWWRHRKMASTDPEARPGPDEQPWVFAPDPAPAPTPAPAPPRKLGVLLVLGVGHHAPGSTLRELGDPVLTLLEDVLTAPDAESVWHYPGFSWTSATPLGTDADPAHAVARLGPEAGAPRTELIVAESRWSDVYRPATFSEMPGWFWQTGKGIAVTMARAALNALSERLVPEVDDPAPALGERVTGSLRASFVWITRFLMGMALLVAALAILFGLGVLAIVLPLVIALLVVGGVVGGLSGRVKSLRATLVSSIGDAFAFEHRHLEHIAIRTKVHQDLEWLKKEGVDRVAIVAHSLGAAITYDLFRHGQPLDRVEAVFTLGSAVMLPGMPDEIEPPSGDITALRDQPEVFWSDLRTSFDPVPTRPLPMRAKAASVRVTNRQSVLRDHTTYVDNSEQVLAPIAGWVLAYHEGDYAPEPAEVVPPVGPMMADHAGTVAPRRGHAEYWRRAGLLRGHRKNAGQGLLIAHLAAALAVVAALPHGFYTNIGSRLGEWLLKHTSGIPTPVRGWALGPFTDASHANRLGLVVCGTALLIASLVLAGKAMAGWDGEVRQRLGRLADLPDLFGGGDLWRVWLPVLSLLVAGTAWIAAGQSTGIVTEARGVWAYLACGSAMISVVLMLGLTRATIVHSRRALRGLPALPWRRSDA